jgi:hypothetical protein
MRDLRVHFPSPCGERWEAMAPAGCDRACAKCDTIVHDLSRHEVDEIEALLRAGPEICVRASVDAVGVVATRAGMRRIVAAVGASAGLLIGQPALAHDKRPEGAIVGKIDTFGFRAKVTAENAAGGLYRARVRSDGRYKIAHVPAGTYALHFVPDCGDGWTIENIVVGNGEASIPVTPDRGGCIIVGKLEIDDNRG